MVPERAVGDARRSARPRSSRRGIAVDRHAWCRSPGPTTRRRLAVPTVGGDVRHRDRDGDRSHLPDVPARARRGRPSPACPSWGTRRRRCPWRRPTRHGAPGPRRATLRSEPDLLAAVRRFSRDRVSADEVRRRPAAGRRPPPSPPRRPASVAARWLPTFFVAGAVDERDPRQRRRRVQLRRLFLLGRSRRRPGSVTASESKSIAKSCSCPVTVRAACGASTCP